MTTVSTPAANLSSATQSFDWPLATDAEHLLRGHLQTCLDKSPFAAQLAESMLSRTGTDFFEWVDHMVLSPDFEPKLARAGFSRDLHAEVPKGLTAYEQPRATLPRVLLGQMPGSATMIVALKPEFVADFISAHDLRTEPEGEPCSRYRRVPVAEENGVRLEAVERRAYRGFVPSPLGSNELAAITKARELWRTRPRRFDSDPEGFAFANRLLERSLALVGRDLSCQFFFEAERAYWEKRNDAGLVQKRRQDLLGLGWGNHDHHTFRCSRQHFVDLVGFLQGLGFQKRERFYAGAEAGWGAQVMEQVVTGIVVFADVDLMPDETQIDFSSLRLAPSPRLGTVGLWVGLHGESFLEAGMHHLEARFDFAALRDQLKQSGIQMMQPFSDFDFLRQAFTEGQRWPVQPRRLSRLLSDRLITREQHDKFLADGAIGSHLENLQRHGGFKGFNQKSVSVVISATDPRKAHF